jgi:uncharacterized protein (DUF111 family)
MHLQAVGHGAGARDNPFPNIVRVWLGEAIAPAPGDEVVELETAIDDMQPELYESLLAALFAEGALDAYLMPAFMKKGRPGNVLVVVAPAYREAALARAILTRSSTFGLRVRPARRWVAERRMESVATAFGPVAIKIKVVDGAVAGLAPEYDHCRAAAAQHDVPVERVYRAALAAAELRFGGFRPVAD